MLLTLLLFLFACAFADHSNDLYPNCDLLAVSYISAYQSRNGLLNMEFAWDRKNYNYAKLDGAIQNYVVKHGPLENGHLTNDSRIVVVKPGKRDELELRNIKPSKEYGIQICALTDSNGKIDDDVWLNHAWIGKYDLSNINSISGHKLKFEHNNFLPQCNLVETSYVGWSHDRQNNTLTVYMSWDQKPESYANLTAINHYRVRHGRADSWGVPIKESDARYMDVSAEHNAIKLTGVPYGSFYGVQICAMTNSHNEKINWQKEAWLGSMDFTPSRPPLPHSNSDFDIAPDYPIEK